MSSVPPAGQGGPEAITLVVTMSIKPEAEEEFLATARVFADLVYANEPGVLTCYRDEATLQHHIQTSYMTEVRPKLGTYLAALPEVLRLAQVVPA